MFGRKRSQDQHVSAGIPADDADLVLAAQADPRAFAALYDRYVTLVYRYCYRRCGDQAQAEDATSVIFYKALAALPAFDNRPGAFRSWLFSIAHNVAIDQTRARQRQAEVPLDEQFDLTARDAAPDEAVIAADERERLAVAIARLPADQRQLMSLRLAGLNSPEIAAALGRSPGAIRVAQHRAINRLRDLLGPDSVIQEEARGD